MRSLPIDGSSTGRDIGVLLLNSAPSSRVYNRPEFSGRHDFQAKKFGRQCTKSGCHAVGLQKIKQKLNAKQDLVHMRH